jgi:hypothetical protein
VTIPEGGEISPGTGRRACLGSGTGGGHLQARELRVRVVLPRVGGWRGGDVGDQGRRGEVARWAQHVEDEVVGLGEMILWWCLILSLVCDV